MIDETRAREIVSRLRHGVDTTGASTMIEDLLAAIADLQRENADLVALVGDMLPYVKRCQREYDNDTFLRPHAVVADRIIDRAKAVTGGQSKEEV